MPARNSPNQIVQYGHKLCSRCDWSKPLTEFYSHPVSLSGHMAACKQCVVGHPSQRPERRRERYRRTRKHRRAYERRWLYGITQDDYDRLVTEQGAVCAICGQPETRLDTYGECRPLSVDHCHETSAIRGLLCHTCNIGLGLWRDDPVRLQGAIDYLARARRA